MAAPSSRFLGPAQVQTSTNSRARCVSLQPLPEDFVFAALGRGQTSFGQSLMEPEELQLAGPDVLSGFGLGTIYVDSGAVGRAELQRPIPLAVKGATAVATPYIFGAYGAGRFEQVFVGENPDVHATSFGGGVRANATFAGWPFNESLSLEAARVTSNVPFARDGYVGTFTYQMKYGGDPFSGGVFRGSWLHARPSVPAQPISPLPVGTGV